MTKISIYSVDNNVTGNDKWIGSDSQNFNATKNFTPNKLADYFNHNQVVDTGNELRYTYQTLDPLEARARGTLSFITEIGPQVNFSAITTFLLSKYTLKQNDVSDYLDFLNGSQVIISKASDTNLFALYKITNVSVYLPEPNFFNIDVTFVDGNGFIYEDQDYIISLALDKYNQPITNTSQLINDGEDGIHPFITAQDLPAQITLTTTGTSGVATLIGNVLNIPDYSVGSTPTLQSVTDQGNTTTNSIIFDNGSGDSIGISNSEIQLSSLNVSGSFSTLFGISLIDNITTEQFRLNLDGLLLKTVSGGNGGIIKADLLTSTLKTYQLPNASGTIALTSDITTPTLNQVLTTGNTSILDANIGTLGIWDTVESAYAKISSTDNLFTIKDPLTNTLLSIEQGSLYLNKTNSINAKVSVLNLTSNRTYYFPDATGTIALTSDLTGYVTSVGATGPITSSGGTTPTISTSMSTNKIIGRTTAGTGTMEEITVGSGLTLSGGTLSATATGGGIPHTTASGTDTYTATVASVTSYADGDAYLVRFTNGNTTACTLNINGLGAIALYRNNDGALIGGDIWSGAEMLCVYNSTTTSFQCIGTSSNSLFAYVTNADSVAITKGQPVYAFGGQGDRLTVKRALNTSDATSAQTVGVVLTSSIDVNQKGIIIIQGLLDGLSILPTSTWADGDPVYLGTTAGSITNVKQYAPNHLVYLGTVTTASNGSSGRWYVRVQNGYELDELHNVQAQSPSLKDTLWYDSGVTPGQWKTGSISSILGYTPFNLPSLTSGSVLFSNGTTIAQDNANFFWDDTNNRLGIGTNLPSKTLHVKSNLSSQIVLEGISGSQEGISSANGGNLAVYQPLTGNWQYGPLSMNPMFNSITYLGQDVFYGNITSDFIPKRATIGFADSLIYDDGTNVGIGTTSPLEKLHVDGSMYLQNSATGVESITFSNGTQIEANDPLGYFRSGNVYTETTGIGNVGINNLAPDDSAMLDVTSTEKGFLPPRMTTTQRNAIFSPAIGLIVYDTTLLSLYQYNGTAWTAVGGGGGGGSTPVKLTSQTLTAASWTSSGGYYTYAFSDVNITTTCDVSVTPQNASYLTAYNAQILPYIAVASGTATFYSQFPPAADMVVDIVITQTT